MPQQVKPYHEAGDKKGQVSTMFNRIAPYYDLLNRLLSLGVDTIWRKKAIDLLRKKQPQIILDVATGTADLALETARQMPAIRQIIGVDISRQMLEIGRHKVTQKGLDGLIRLEEGDSENLPFTNNTFDAITVAFGVRNFADLERGLSEMQRVLKPGGQLIVLEFSKPRIFPFRQVFNFYFRYILPLIGRITSRDPRAYRYLYESVQAFPEGEHFLSILTKTGFKASQCTPLTLGVCSIYSAEK